MTGFERLAAALEDVRVERLETKGPRPMYAVYLDDRYLGIVQREGRDQFHSGRRWEASVYVRRRTGRFLNSFSSRDLAVAALVARSL